MVMSLVALVVLNGCAPTQKTQPDEARTQLDREVEEVPNQDFGQAEHVPELVGGTEPHPVVGPLALEVVARLARKDIAWLASMAHPKKGIRFSPYAYVDPEEDVVLSSEEIVQLWNSGKALKWGYWDGEGGDIDFTFSEYYERFVYDADFVQSDEWSFNHSIGLGNTRDNSSEVYPGSVIVEFHIPGVDPQYGGMDWRSLRLVFEDFAGEWYLVGIIHAEWTA